MVLLFSRGARMYPWRVDLVSHGVLSDAKAVYDDFTIFQCVLSVI